MTTKTFTDRLQSVPPWVLLIQLFIGLGWVRAGVEKMISPQWWVGAELDDFLATHDAVPWYQPFLDYVVEPIPIAVAVAVMIVQLAIGAAMLLGRRIVPALAIGMFLNLHFIAAGAVNPSAFYLLAQGAVALWIAETSRRPSTRDALELVSVGAAALAVVSLPWIRTFVPEAVIDDPAIMLATAGGLTALTCELCRRRLDAPSPSETEFAPIRTTG